MYPEKNSETALDKEPSAGKEPSANEKPLPKELLQSADLWRASSIGNGVKKGLSSGFQVLDQYLPGAGWPVSGVTELLHDQVGIGELRLLTPALARLSHTQNRWLLWVSPPYIPYPPALFNAGIDLTSVLVAQPKTTAETLWVIEKALASKSCSAVLAWPQAINEKQIRRLQVASKEGDSWNILFRASNAASNASPAELRIQLFPTRTPEPRQHTSINLKILKRRGGWATDVINIPFNDNLNRVTLKFAELFSAGLLATDQISTGKQPASNLSVGKLASQIIKSPAQAPGYSENPGHHLVEPINAAKLQ